MDEVTAKRLLDAYLACRRIRAVAREHNLASYEASWQTQMAVERLLEIVGEALNYADRLDSALKHELPELPQIVSTRNRIAHGYDTINNATIWSIVEERIYGLEHELRLLLVRNGFGSDFPPDSLASS